ncbi:hypothetical protein [Streptomyces sp. NPDC054783]
MEDEQHRRHRLRLLGIRRQAGPAGRTRAAASDSYPAKFPYTAAGTSALNDVTSGDNGTCTTSCLCTARSGHDGPTGWGTPEGTSVFTG